MKRIALFVATNLGILVVITVLLRVLGLEQVLTGQGAQLDLPLLLVASAVVGMTGAFISLALSKRMAIWSTGVKIIEQPTGATERWLLDTVRRQAERSGIGMPQVGIFDSATPNAFATGMNRNAALVAVSSGLLRQMNEAEVEAVLGHEVAHVANGDMVTLALIQGVVNTFVFFLSRVIGTLVDRAVFKTERGHGPGYFITVIVAQLVLGVLASAVVLWFSRKREFAADAGGAALAGRANMIAALERLQGATRAPELPDQLAAFGISGHVKHGLSRLFMSHPPIEERIAALRAAGA